jgi:hypothetical protein
MIAVHTALPDEGMSSAPLAFHAASSAAGISVADSTAYPTAPMVFREPMRYPDGQIVSWDTVSYSYAACPPGYSQAVNDMSKCDISCAAERLSLYPKLLEHYARRAQDRQQIEQALRELIVQGIWKWRTLGKAA